jgi:homocysteine S-methyltransferase
MANLLEALGSRIVVGDGAVAAYLYAEGVPLGRSFEGMNLTDPDRVSAAHRIYLEAGAEVIATNSFAANRACLRRHGLEEKVSEINWKAAKLALGEVGKSGAWVVGTMGPSGISQPEFSEGRYLYANHPNYFAQRMAELPALGVNLLGGGSGVSPAHIRALKAKVSGLKPTTQVRAAVEPKREAIQISRGAGEPKREESILDRLKKERIAVVELDSPRGLDMGPFFKAAEELVKAGATALTLADNSLAILRVANTAAATLLREKFGTTSLIHLACRDKNLIGLQSELMGLAALGHRHVLALTGDPSKFGDHPGATSVYDVNSLGLIDLIRQLNEGRNSAGREVGKGAEFVIGVAFSPNSKNFDAQVKKLERKIEKGAHFVMTQPVYELEMIRKMKDALGPLGIPVLVGVMPVVSARNAEFLHHEVPGISIPDRVREKIRSLPEGPAQADYGREVAAELAREVAQHFRGIYLITPMVRSGMTAPIVEEFLKTK